MKPALALALAVTTAVGASAEEPIYVTEYYDECSTLPTTTVIDTVIHNWYPGSVSGGGGGGIGAYTPHAGVLTTYTTVYDQICSTGFEPKTFTVTEPCSESGQARAPTYIPQGFVKTTVTCHVCAETPVVAVITSPVPAPRAPGAAPVPAPTPTGGYPGGSPPGSGGSAPPVGAQPPAGAPPINGGAPPAGVPATNGGAPPAGPPANNGGASPPANGASPPPNNGGTSPPGGAVPPASGGGTSPGGSVPPVGANPPAVGGAGPGGAGPGGANPGGAGPGGAGPGGASPTPARYGGAPTKPGSASPPPGSSGDSSIVPFTGLASSQLSSIGMSFLVGLFGVVGVVLFAL